MRRLLTFLVFVLLLVATTALWASGPQAGNSSPQTSSGATYLVQNSDDDAARGCCVWRPSEALCSYTNRGYCRQKAQEQGVEFTFHAGKSCREVPACGQ